MKDASPALHALARRVVAAETASCGADQARLAAAFELMFARLQDVTAAMVGDLGYLSLMARAVRITRRTYLWMPVLPLAVASPAVEFPRARWQPYLALASNEDCAAGAALLFANLLGLLASFIGEDFTFRLTRRAWPDDGSSADRSGAGEF